ncbi:MAG: hypothetical protein AAFR38_04290 [Planctomycetota bacterium]
MTRPSPRSAFTLAAGLTLAAFGLSGCGSIRPSPISRIRGDFDRERVDLGAFVAQRDAAGPLEASGTGGRPGPAPDPVGGGDDDPVGGERPEPPESFRVEDFVTIVAAPAEADGQTVASDDPRLLDAKVGEINGRAIFASEFLEPISGRLRAEARRLPLPQWRAEAAQRIAQRLRGELTDELLRAEALSRLDAGQRQGLRAFLERVRTQLLSQNLGSRELATQRLAETEGLTEEEFLQRRGDTELVRLTINREIESRINVSWRDVVRRYNRDSERWNPPPTARLRLIRVGASDEAGAETIASMLASDKTFVEVASDRPNRFNVSEGGLREIEYSGPYDEATFFNIEEINEAARGLEIGGTAGPIRLSSGIWWVHLESIESASIPLYEAQLAILAEIRAERRDAERERFIGGLIARASQGEVNAIGQRLLEIAELWYGPGSDARAAP